MVALSEVSRIEAAQPIGFFDEPDPGSGRQKAGIARREF
jgi:hypothetical protein